jgi:phage gpG-like protein
MALSGDFSGLERWRRRVASVTRAGFNSELAQVLGATAMKQVADGFRKSQDPYGTPWAPLKSRKGKPLLDTGRMAASVNVQPQADGFLLNIPTSYAPVHQYGAQVPPHSRIGKRTLWHNPKTGRIVSRTTRLKMVTESSFSRQTHNKGITIPRRQMVPERSTGGLGPIWGRAFSRETSRLVRLRMSA